MAAKVTFDPTTKIISVTQAPVSGEVNIDVKIDIYSDGKEDWLANESLSRFRFPISAVGGNPLPGSKALGTTFFLLYGWKIRPYEASHTMNVNGNLYCQDGTSPYVPTLGTFSIAIIGAVSSLVDSTIQQLPEIEQGSYESGVTIDVVNGVGGTAYPVGTPKYPVNNLAQAKTIAEDRGFDTLFVYGELIIGAAESISEYTLIGLGATFNIARTSIILTSGCTTSNTRFENLRVDGRQNGESEFLNCVVGVITNSHCQFHDCKMVGMVSVANSSWVQNHTTDLKNCYSVDWYIVDYNSSPLNQIYANYSGKIKIINCTDSRADIIIQLDSGEVWIDASCTAGNITVRGVGTIIEDSVGAVVNVQGLISTESSNAATLEQTQSIQYLVESIRERNLALGDSYFWSPYDGNDANDGLRPITSLKTFAAALAKCASGGHDIIFAMCTDPSGITTTNEQLVMNKNSVYLRGAGLPFVIETIANTGHSVVMSGTDCSISNLKITHNSTGTAQHAISITGGYCSVENLLIDGVRKHGILVDNAEHVDIINTEINECGMGDGMAGDCIEFKNAAAKHGRILDCILGESDIGVCFELGAAENVVKGTLIHDNGVGIKHTSAAHDTYIFNDCIFALNSSDILDEVNDGTLIIEENERLIANSDAVWEKNASDHITAGTFGSLLNDVNSEAFGKWILNPTAKTMTLYKADNSVLKVFNLGDTTDPVPAFISRTPV